MADRGYRATAPASASDLSAMIRHMFMLHGRLAAKPGRRDELLAILNESANEDALPGCRLYVIALDEHDPDGVWATEIWESAAAHTASLEISRVQERIGRAMPLIDADGFRQQRLDALSGVPLIQPR
jgi:quinol monooxygenase YgiN